LALCSLLIPSWQKTPTSRSSFSSHRPLSWAWSTTPKTRTSWGEGATTGRWVRNGREDTLTRLRFNLARAWSQRRGTHKGRGVVSAAAGNIPSTARSPGARPADDGRALTGAGTQGGDGPAPRALRRRSRQGGGCGRSEGLAGIPGYDGWAARVPRSRLAHGLVPLRGNSPGALPSFHELNCSRAAVSSAWERALLCQLHLWLCYLLGHASPWI